MDLAYKQGLFWKSRTGRINDRRVTCPICGERVPPDSAWDIHEVLVKRGAVSISRQKLIFVPENQVPVHHQCHMERGDSSAAECLAWLLAVRGSEVVGKWYLSLWQDHDLSIVTGRLLPRNLNAQVVRNLLDVGLAISLTEIKVSDQQLDLVKACSRWASGKQPRPVDYHIHSAIEAGYWTHYMSTVVGVDPWELVRHKDSLHLYP